MVFHTYHKFLAVARTCFRGPRKKKKITSLSIYIYMYVYLKYDVYNMIFLTESDGCFPIWFNNIAKRFLPLRPAKRRSQLGPWPTRPDCPETLPGQKTVFKTSFPTIINNHWIGLRDIVQETIIHRIYMYLLLNLGVSCKLSLKPIHWLMLKGYDMIWYDIIWYG